MRRTLSCHFPLDSLRCAAAGALLLLAAARTSAAQTPSAAPPPAAEDDAVCLGFSFGSWTPALNWRAAGHGASIDSSHLGHAPGGRGWAAGGTVPADSTLLLFPPWWPVGVEVALPTRTPAPGDTVVGRATALVSDGRARPPSARVRAWRVKCGGAR